MKWIAAGVEDCSSAAALLFAYRAVCEIRATPEGVAVVEEQVSDGIGLARLELPVYCDAVAGEPVDVLRGCAIGADLLLVDGERHGRRCGPLNRSPAARCADRGPGPLEIVRGDASIAQAHPQRAIS